MTPRLGSAVLVSALLRKAEAEGGYGAVLAKGDKDSGAILLILLERGRNTLLLERLLGPGGDYSWVRSPALAADEMSEVPSLIARRRRFDPDLWVLELDVPSAERFAAGMTAFD